MLRGTARLVHTEYSKKRIEKELRTAVKSEAAENRSGGTWSRVAEKETKRIRGQLQKKDDTSRQRRQNGWAKTARTCRIKVRAAQERELPTR